MLDKKRVFLSLGAGVFIFVSGLFLMLFAWRLLNSPQWMLTGMIWILVWPIRLSECVIGIPYTGRVGLAISIGITSDVAILSGLIYAVLSLF